MQVFEDDGRIIEDTTSSSNNKSSGNSRPNIPSSMSTIGSGINKGNAMSGGISEERDTDDDEDDTNNNTDYQHEIDEEREERDRLITEEKARMAALNQMSDNSSGAATSEMAASITNGGVPMTSTSSVLLTPPAGRSRGHTDSKVPQRSPTTAPSSSATTAGMNISDNKSDNSEKRHRLRTMDPDSLRYRLSRSNGGKDGSPIPVVGRRTASPLPRKKRPNGYAVVILSALPLVQLLRDALRSLPLQRDLNVRRPTIS
jgi:hypothetical protein